MAEKMQPGGESSESPSPPSTPLRGARDRWQVPTLIVALGLLGAGLYSAITSSAGPDFQGVMFSAAGEHATGLRVEIYFIGPKTHDLLGLPLALFPFLMCSRCGGWSFLPTAGHHRRRHERGQEQDEKS